MGIIQGKIFFSNDNHQNVQIENIFKDWKLNKGKLSRRLIKLTFYA